jgi:hypothetical protein
MSEGALENDIDYTDWDAQKMMGCKCDEGFFGYNCAQKQCPMGDDPSTTGTREVQVLETTLTDVVEVQTISVTGTDVNEV